MGKIITKTFTFTLTNDVLDEPNETFTITLSESDANGDLGSNNVTGFYCRRSC